MKLAPNPDEVMDTAWVGIPEVLRGIQSNPEQYTPWLKIYLELHSEQIFA